MSGRAHWPRRHVGSLRLEPSSLGTGGQFGPTWAWRSGGQNALCPAACCPACCAAQGQAETHRACHQELEDPSPNATALRPPARPWLPGYCVLPSPFLPSHSLGLATGLLRPLLGLASGPSAHGPLSSQGG